MVILIPFARRNSKTVIKFNWKMQTVICRVENAWECVRMNQVKGKIQTENGRKSYTENSEPEPTGCTRRAGSEGSGFCAKEKKCCQKLIRMRLFIKSWLQTMGWKNMPISLSMWIRSTLQKIENFKRCSMDFIAFEETKHGRNNSMDFLRLQKYRTPLLMKL